MKISNSKKELARIISENGGWRDGAEWSAQDKNHAGRLRKVVFYCGDKPWIDAGDDYWGGNNTHDEFIISDRLIKNWHQTILSRAEYFHLYPAPDADGWIEWKGGECPVGGDVMVACKVRTGKEFRGGKKIKASILRWRHTGGMADIIAYRLHKPNAVKPTDFGAIGDGETNLAVKEGRESMEYQPTIEQLAADYRNAKDYAERKQQEADAAKADVEAKLAELVAAGNALGLVLRVVGVEPELVITDWRDLQAGDLVWVEGEGGRVAEGEYEVLEVEAPGYDGKRTIRIRGGEGGQFWINYENGWRFIRRP